MDNAVKGNTSLKQHIAGLLPWMVAIRRRVRIKLSYIRMRMDGNIYSATQRGDSLPHRLFSGSEALYNEKTGYPMLYQHNKVHNLKLVARVLDGIVIKPGETFSFWMLARYADRTEKYRDGLVSVNGKLTTAPGGGLCQMSNSLFWAFLHTPLDIVERHGHMVKEFPEPNSASIKGVDATIAEGMKDLKVYNATQYSYRLSIGFGENDITVAISTDDPAALSYHVRNGDTIYSMRGGEVWEYAPVCRNAMDAEGHPAGQELVYVNSCRIGYALPEGTQIMEEGQSWALN